MIRLNVPHPPAAATTLIVSLGVVSRPAHLVVLEAAVGLLVGQAIIINRLTGVRYPLWASVPTPKIGALASRGALQRFTRFLWLAITVALSIGIWPTPAYAQDPAVVNSKTIRVRFEYDRVCVLEASRKQLLCDSSPLL